MTETADDRGRRMIEASAVGAGGERAAGAEKLRAFLARELGDTRVRVERDGPEGELAVVTVPRTLLPRVLEGGFRRRVVERALEVGFRYAAVDPGPAGE